MKHIASTLRHHCIMQCYHLFQLIDFILATTPLMISYLQWSPLHFFLGTPGLHIIYCEGTRIHGSFDCKHRHHFCAQNFAASPHFIPKIIAAPASMLITMAGTAPGHSSLWPGPHRDTHHYGRDRTGTALTHSLLWPDRTETLFTMAGTAPGHSLLWPGPHQDAVYYGGRDRTGTLITMAGTAPGPCWHTHYYGRDRTGTQFTMAGTAPGRWLLWPGPTHRLDLTK